MKIKLVMALVTVMVSFQAQGQSNPPTFIKGSLNINFGTRTKTAPVDKYTLNVNVSDSAIFHGSVNSKPFLPGVLKDENGLLTYDLSCDIVNPKNTAQTRNVGKLFGTVPVDAKNVYRFNDGNLKVSVLSLGTAKGFDSRFTGYALGKPPQAGFMAKMKQEAIKFSRSNNGKTVGITVTKYDKMEFQNHTLASGPVQIYPEVTLNGVMVYDYGRSVWYLQNMTAVYNVDGRQLADKLSGNIRWVESPNRKSTGEGEYQFDIRVNEPLASEASLFSASQDESSFFDVDTSIPSLTGSMKYKDSMSGEVVSASTVNIDLLGNKLSKQQIMYLCKFILLSSIVPLNAE